MRARAASTWRSAPGAIRLATSQRAEEYRSAEYEEEAGGRNAGNGTAEPAGGSRPQAFSIAKCLKTIGDGSRPILRKVCRHPLGIAEEWYGPG